MTSPKTEFDTGAVAALVARAGRGDEDAWRELVRQYARRVAALVRSRSGNPDLAEEITQSVFVTVAEHLGSGRYVEQGRFESWLFRIAMNRLRDERRRERRSPMALNELEPSESTPAKHDDPAAIEQLRHAVSQLSETDQEIIAMRHHAQLEFKTIAELLKEPLGTVLARHHRALKKLRSMLAPQDEGDRA